MSGYKIKRLGKPRASTAHSYFTFGSSSVTPVPLPPLPKWMLDTPINSKLPMIPAPKGKIVLHTTGLCEKLHHTLSELDFDPNPQGLSTEYSSLHDKHLKSHYSHASMVSRLVRNGFITPEGKVVCTLKEFNDYQQHLKRVRLEIETQDRKRRTRDEREEKERFRWCRPKTSEQIEREKHAEEIRERKDNIMKEELAKIAQRQQEKESKNRQLLDEKHHVQKAEEAFKRKEQERARRHKIQLSKEEKRKKVYYLRRRAKEEKTRAEKLEMRRQMAKEARENKLEQNWERKLLFQELRDVEGKLKKLQEEEVMEANIGAREMATESQRKMQQAAYDRIREARAKQTAEKEHKIVRHLEAKHMKVQVKYDRTRQRITGRYNRSSTTTLPQRRYHHTMRTSTWEITECLLADICSNIRDGEGAMMSSRESPFQKLSSQELPEVSPPGVCRKVSWHDSMTELMSTERLPAIGSCLFNEDDEETYSESSPEPSTSEELGQLQVRDISKSPFTTSGSYECSSRPTSEEEDTSTFDMCAPVIEIQLEEEEQDRSLEFTEEDLDHFMDMEAHDSSHTCKSTNAIIKMDHEGSGRPVSVLGQYADIEEHQTEENDPTKPCEVAKTVVSTVILKAMSSLFQCIGSSDTLSLASESCQSRLDTQASPNQVMVEDAEISSYIEKRLTPFSDRTSDGVETISGESVTQGEYTDTSELQSDSPRELSPVPVPSDALLDSHQSKVSFTSDEADTTEHVGDDDVVSTESENVGYSLTRSSTLLQSVIDVFGEPPVDMGEYRSSSSEDLDEDEDDDEEDGEIIGFLENPSIAEETATSITAECMASQEDDFTEVVSESNESRSIVEGAIRRASSGDFFKHKGSITEAVLSIENLTRSASSKRLVRERVSGKYSSDGDNEELQKTPYEPEDHYHQIIPLYHNQSVDVGEHLIDSNLSAISMKPDLNKDLPHAHQTGSRNSFRNIFRPDLTYCEGSAKCLKSTLIRQLSHSSASSGGSSHSHMMRVLDQEHHDVTAHHSNEEIVHTDDAEGVCQWPKSRTFKVHHVIDDVVAELDEPSEQSDASDQEKKTEINKEHDLSEITTGQLDIPEDNKNEKEKDKDIEAETEEKDDQPQESNNRNEDERKVEQVDDLKNEQVQPIDVETTEDKEPIDDTKEVGQAEEDAEDKDKTLNPGSASSLVSNKLCISGGEDSSVIDTALESPIDGRDTPQDFPDKNCPDTTVVNESQQVPQTSTIAEKEIRESSTQEEASNKNTNRSKLSSMSISAGQSSGTSTDGVLIKVSEKRSSFVSTASQRDTNEDDIDNGESEKETDNVWYDIDQSSDEQGTTCHKDKTIPIKDRKKKCNRKKVRVKVKQAAIDTDHTHTHRHSSKEDKKSDKLQQQVSSPYSKSISKLKSVPSKASKRCTPKVSSIVKGSDEVVKRRLHKKSHCNRLLNASKSMMNGNRRPSTAKLHHITQSKSANAPSHDKSVNTASRIHHRADEIVVSKDCPSSGSTNATKIDSLIGRDHSKSLSSHQKEHSVIFVQPAKEKRSSCTVIMPVNRKSSAIEQIQQDR